ncbi:DUF4190 domain-containing protein [Gillisia sp. M10.2A]|uniref:DUF4190 domain-containing protein n=1 Tax=Gillisia lutea TaxID=2909668 RepID=A0ABS9EIW4_9FLAO|nr:CCC motif membrane protein [Gillisia lutea]MCF4102790.1 DUF4190 domain-containing protein [Gillisia lutea]
MNIQRQELPNSTLILVFGILSIVGCCCYGIVGLIFGVLAIVMAKKAKEIYLASPELYIGYQNVNTGRILAIIGVVLSAIVLISNIIFLIFIGENGMMEILEEVQREYGG